MKGISIEEYLLRRVYGVLLWLELSSASDPLYWKTYREFEKMMHRYILHETP